MSEKEAKDMNGSAARGSPQASAIKNGAIAKKKKTKYVISGLLLLIIIIIILIALYFLLHRSEDNRGIVTEDNVDEIELQMQQAAEGAYYETSMTIDWTFENGKAASSDAFVENSTANKHTVYFDLNLSDSNELIYSSPYIPVGKSLNNITLNKNLKKGDYPAVVTYHLVNDDKEEVSKVAVEVTLHILN